MPISQIVTNSIADSAVVTADIANGAVTQAKLGTNIVGNGPAFSVSRTTNYSVSLAAYVKVQFNSVTFDTNSNWDAANFRFTPSVAGYYQFNLNITTGSSSVGESITTIWKNGSESAWSAIGTAAGRCTPTVSTVLYMNGTTDYVEGYAYIATGTSPIVVGNTQRTSFSGCLVRAA